MDFECPETNDFGERYPCKTDSIPNGALCELHSLYRFGEFRYVGRIVFNDVYVRIIVQTLQ